MHGAHSRLATSFCVQSERNQTIFQCKKTLPTPMLSVKKISLYRNMHHLRTQQTNLTKLLDIDFDKGPVKYFGVANFKQ